MYNYSYRYPNYNNQGRGFLGPFLLGGLTGAIVAPAFYRPYNYNRPYYGYNPGYYYYGGYYY